MEIFFSENAWIALITLEFGIIAWYISIGPGGLFHPNTTRLVGNNGAEQRLLIRGSRAILPICWCICTRPLKNVPFCPIFASGSDFNPQNTQCIPAAKIFAFDSGHPCPFTAAGPPSASPILLSCRIVLNWNRIEHFSKVSVRWVQGFHMQCR